jgi:DNA recombination protein RmuC
VEHVWAVERRRGNAEEIARQAGALYDKVVGFLASMESVGVHIGKASDAHEKAMGQLSRGRGNVLRRLETLKEMGAVTTKTQSIPFDDEPEGPPRIEAEGLPSPPREGRGRGADLALSEGPTCDVRS